MKKPYSTISSKYYLKSRKEIAICNLSSYTKITVYGPDALNLLNRFSIRDLSKIDESAYFTVMMKKKKYFKSKYICEVMIIKLSPLKYIIITQNDNGFYKLLKKTRRKVPLVTIDLSTDEFAFFAFHGEKANEYFANLNSPVIYKVDHQGYQYNVILTASVNKFSVIDHFLSLGFWEIDLQTHELFLHSKTVITNLDKITENQTAVIMKLYKGDNFKGKVKDIPFIIKQFETTQNLIVTKNMPIFNGKRKKVGYVHNFYRLANKKNPFVIGIIKLKKTQNDKIALLKYNKKEIIIKEYYAY